MRIENLYYSSRFQKSLKKFSKGERRIIQKRLELFAKDSFDSSLKTHKLSGKFSGYWSFSIDFDLRIMFEFVDEKSVGLVDVGTHSIYG